MQVKLLSWTNNQPAEQISLAAKTCYTSKPPQNDKILDIENILWKTGHHTTLEHFFVSFYIEGISISDVTFGLHLTHPFYNTSQRSGRYAAKMFWQPNWDEINEYLDKFWPEVSNQVKKSVIDYLRQGINNFQNNHSAVSEIAKEFLRKERPFLAEKDVNRDAPKIAQEQLRMFIPTIFPTALVYTVNLIALAAMQRSAWDPPMRFFVQKMVDLVLEKFPELKFVYNWDIQQNPDWDIDSVSQAGGILEEPKLKILTVNNFDQVKMPLSSEIGPLDLLQFKPDLMDLHLVEIITEVEISIATMGQDQRHRTLRRGQPAITGNFYCPPLLVEANLKKLAQETLENWFSLKDIIPQTLWLAVAPYGAMVKYKKIGDLNAIIHEQNKRLCWRAQEEIYWLSCLLRKELVKQDNPSIKKFLNLLTPPCFDGQCPEGPRYCGRDLKIGDWFVRRKV